MSKLFVDNDYSDSEISEPCNNELSIIDEEELPKKVKKKKKKKIKKKKTKHKDEVSDPFTQVNSLFNMKTKKKKKKDNNINISLKDIKIDEENDTESEIIHKLVKHIQYLENEVKQLRIYIDGTFTMSSVTNRIQSKLEREIEQVNDKIDDLC